MRNGLRHAHVISEISLKQNRRMNWFLVVCAFEYWKINLLRSYISCFSFVPAITRLMYSILNNGNKSTRSLRRLAKRLLSLRIKIRCIWTQTHGTTKIQHVEFPTLMRYAFTRTLLKQSIHWKWKMWLSGTHASNTQTESEKLSRSYRVSQIC